MMTSKHSRRRVRRTGQRQAFLADTALAIYLSLNIEVIDDDRGKRLAAMPSLPLTWLWLLIWRFRLRWTTLKWSLHRWRGRRPRCWPQTPLVLAWILGRSLVWGLAGV